jgi:biotin operon repressor
MKNVKKSSCISCGKKNLTKDEVGINLKLIGEDTQNFYCLDCIANILDVSVQDILDKIEEFKEEGCTLFL